MTIAVKIGATEGSMVDRASSIKPFKTFKMKQESCEFRILEVSPYTLTIAQEQVIVVEDSTLGTPRVWGGRVKTIQREPREDAGRRSYIVKGTSYNDEAKASRCTPSALRTASESDKARITWLLTNFDTRGIVDSALVQTVMGTMTTAQDFTGMSLEEAIDAIAKITGAFWYIDYNKNLHYFATETNNAPFGIDIQSPNGTTTKAAYDFTFDDDTSEYYSDVYIYGDGVEGSRSAVSPAFTPRRYFVIRDQNIGDATTLNAVGDAFLLEHNKAVGNGSFTTRFSGLKDSQNIGIDNDDYWSGTRTYRIHSVEPTWSSDGSYVTYKVQFGDVPPPSLDQLLAKLTQDQRSIEHTVADVVATTPDITTLDAAGANLVLNSSFESAATPGWTVGTGWTLNYASAQPAFWGGEVARCVRSGTASGNLIQDNFISVDRTDDYWVSVWSWLIARSAGNARVYLREYDGASTLLQSSLIVDLTAVQTKWVRHAVHFGPTSTGGRVAFHASTVKVKMDAIAEGSANLTWEIDGLQVERGELLTAYAPRPQELIDEQITATQLATDSVTSPKIIANAVVAGKIAAGAVTAEKIDAQAVRVGHFMDPANAEWVPNPSFEDVTGITVGNFSQPIPGWESQSYARIVNSPVDTGGFALEMVGNGSNRDLLSAFSPVISSRRLRLKGRVRGNAGNNAASAVELSFNTYDSSKALLSSGQAATTVVVGAGTTYTDLTCPDFVITAGTAFVKVRARVTSATPSGSEVYFDSLQGIYLDIDIAHAAGDVLIDSLGIHVKSGVIDIEDKYGVAAVLTGGGFGGAWSHFMHSRFYNGDFLFGSTSDIAVSETGGADTESEYQASISQDLPYWVVLLSGSTLKIVTDTEAGGQKALSSLQTAASQVSSVYQDVPVTPGRQYAVIWRYKVIKTGSGTMTLSFNGSWRNADRSLIGSAPTEAALPQTDDDGDYHGAVDQQIMKVSGRAPAGATFWRAHIEMTHGTFTGGTHLTECLLDSVTLVELDLDNPLIGCVRNVTANFAATTSTWTPVDFNAGTDEHVSHPEMVSTTGGETDRVIVPSYWPVGFWRVTGLINWQSSTAGSVRDIGIGVNGSNPASAAATRDMDAAPASAGRALGISVLLMLNPGDYIRLMGLQNSGANLNITYGRVTMEWAGALGI